MGQAVEDMLNGLACQVCGQWMDDFEECGYPRTCAGCTEECTEDAEKSIEAARELIGDKG